jgi:acetoin utilization deacetylase AcuC-like enzyme
LRQILPELFEQVKPDFCFFQAGVDILETDKYGKLKVTLQGCKKRDEILFSLVKSHSVPCVVSMGGGYSPDIRNIVEAHCNTFRTAINMYS